MSTVVVLLVGLALALVAARDEPLELLWYFTVQVDLAYLAALCFRRDGGLRTALTVYLVVTGLVFVLVLANPWSGYSMVATADARGTVSDAGNLLLHVVAPPLAAADWFTNRPRPAPPRGYPVSLLAYPLAWLTAILARGAGSGQAEERYLYPFLDVPRLGYPTVVVNALTFAALVLLLGLAATRLSRRAPAARLP
ncbi:Pr6Pr family membrane protein [Micromonospora avicenniae]|uniref:Pr6Pr family membrane protein n=1 Tax=Micromonospora avicenniae TaxID=1198245 RepID=UPI00341D9E62